MLTIKEVKEMRKCWARGENLTDKEVEALYDYVVRRKEFIEKVRDSKWPNWNYKYVQYQLAKRFLLKVYKERVK